jgi:hypothetical protein
MKMRKRATFGLFVLGCLSPAYASIPKPGAWVPVRWPWPDAKSLELLAGTPVNCLLLGTWPAELVAAASDRGMVTLAVIPPDADPAAATKTAIGAKVTGIVLEGDFPVDSAAAVRTAAGEAPVIEMTARSRLVLGGKGTVLATYQGVWPGISAQEDGGHKAGPTGSTWIDTNTGFIRAVRAWGPAALWLGNQPPPQTIVTGARYLQVIADAAISGARWVVAFDSDFASRLSQRDAGALSDWQRMSALLGYFEKHAEWREMRETGMLAVVQDTAKSGLISGGILDMIAVKHTPVRPVPPQRLNAAALAGATMAVNVDVEAITAEQKELLRNFTRSGGTLLTAPPGWRGDSKSSDITLEKKELERLNDIFRDVNNMIGRRNLGVRLFNVSSMLSNLVATPDGKTVILQLVNYADYPVEDVTVHFMGKFRRAVLMTPDGVEKPLDIYPTEEGGGVDLAKVAVCATVRLEQ